MRLTAISCSHDHILAQRTPCREAADTKKSFERLVTRLSSRPNPDSRRLRPQPTHYTPIASIRNPHVSWRQVS